MSNPMKQPTPRGYNPYELMSAMQKFVRRSMEREALFCFYELEAAGLYYAAASRLTVIVYEDCGMANPALLNSIQGHMEQMAKWWKANNGAWRLVLGNIILQACRGKKTRIADHFVCSMMGAMVNGYKVDLEQYSEFVFDMHTRQGKQMGRGLDHFFEHGMTIIESTETTDYANDEMRELLKAEKISDDISEDYKKDPRNLAKQGDLF
jgi:replication-associated recombination protein RarA